MNQAMLITAYKQPDWVERIIKRLGPDFSFFIHIDRKSSAADLNQFNALSVKYGNIAFLTNHYKVNWGGVNHLLAILLLVKKALALGMDYCHLITGQDYPVKSIDYFNTQLDSGKNYMEYFLLPTSKWKNGGLDRMTSYHFCDYFDPKTPRGAIANTVLKGIQQVLSIKRRLFDGMRPYGGSTYWSLNRECLEYVMAFIRRNPDFLNRCRYTLLTDEFFFQTILLNSPLRDTIINDNRRYICWQEERYGSLPAILDASDFQNIVASEALFARKIGYPESEELINQLNRNVHHVVLSPKIRVAAVPN